MTDHLPAVQKVIDVQTVDGLQRISAVCAGALAAHRTVCRDMEISFTWSITHLPSGLSFPFEFYSDKDALAAMSGLQAVCDWSAYEIGMKAKVAAAVNRICRQHDGEPTRPNPEKKKLAETAFRRDLNGRTSA